MPPADITAPDAAAQKFIGGKLLIPFTIGHFANDWAPTGVWLIVPAMAVTMNLSPAEVGLIFTIHSVGSAVAFLPAGILADRVTNRGRLLQLTFWWVAVGYTLASFAPGYWSLALLLAFAGMGDAVWHPIATGVLVQQAPERRAQALGTHAIGGSLAAVLSPLCAGFLLVYVDWREALLLSAIPAAIMGVVFLRFAKHVPPPNHEPTSQSTNPRSFWRVWMRPDGLALIVMISAYSMAMMALLSMSPLFLQTVHGLTLTLTGLALSLMLLFGALLQPMAGKVSDRIGRRPLFVAGNVIATVAAVAIALAPGPTLAIVAMVITATALVSIRSVVLAAAVDLSAKREATTLGFTFAVMDGVGALGAVSAGALGNIDLRYAFILVACLCTLAVVMAFVAPYSKMEEET